MDPDSLMQPHNKNHNNMTLTKRTIKRPATNTTSTTSVTTKRARPALGRVEPKPQPQPQTQTTIQCPESSLSHAAPTTANCSYNKTTTTKCLPHALTASSNLSLKPSLPSSTNGHSSTSTKLHPDQLNPTPIVISTFTMSLVTNEILSDPLPLRKSSPPSVLSLSESANNAEFTKAIHNRLKANGNCNTASPCTKLNSLNISDSTTTTAAATITPAATDVIDIDFGREESPAHCVTYVHEIYQSLRENEKRVRPDPINFLKIVQNEVTPSMRGVLIDWLVEVAEENCLSSETLYLTKNYIDRFLAIERVQRSELQLVGATALLIAAKFEEVDQPPKIDDFVYFCDNTYSRESIILMEQKILKKLRFKLVAATEKTFLRRFQRAAAAHVHDRHALSKIVLLSNYLTELTMQDYSFVDYHPSTIASAAVALSLAAFRAQPWSSTLEYYTQYRWTDERLQSCIRSLIVLYRSVSQTTGGELQAVFKKYATPKYHQIARLNLNLLPPKVVQQPQETQQQQQH